MSFFEPKTLSDMVGNKVALNTLRAILDKKDMAPQLYIFEGASGVGKTALAKFFLKELTGTAPKKFNPNAYSEIPEWGDLGSSPIIFEEAVRIPKESWDTICNIHDGTKPHPVFVFITSDYFKLPPQIKTRAYRVQLSKLTQDEMMGFLSRICAEHDISYELSALGAIAKLTKGVPKEGIKFLQAVSLQGPITAESVSAVAPVELEAGCNAILSRLVPNFSGAINALDKLELSYSTTDIIDGLLSAYSNAVFNRNDSPIFEGICSNLSNYRKMTDIFLKWKSGVSLPSNCLPLLLKELAESDEVVASSQTGVTTQVATKKQQPVWEVGASEFARLCNAEVVE
jgi:hypothetical protein